MLKFFIHDYHLLKEEQFLNQQLSKGYLFQKSFWLFYFFKKAKNKKHYLYIDLVESHIPAEMNQLLHVKRVKQDMLKLYLDSQEQLKPTRIDTKIQTKYLDTCLALNRRNSILLLAVLITLSPLILVFKLSPLLISFSLALFTLCISLLGLELIKSRQLKKMTTNQLQLPLRYLIFFTQPNYTPLEDHLSFLGTWKILFINDTFAEYELFTTLSEREILGEISTISLESHQSIQIVPPKTTLSMRANILDQFINNR